MRPCTMIQCKFFMGPMDTIDYKIDTLKLK